MEWSIGRTAGGSYTMTDYGFWNGYGGEARDALTYPVTGFRTYTSSAKTTVSRYFGR